MAKRARKSNTKPRLAAKAARLLELLDRPTPFSAKIAPLLKRDNPTLDEVLAAGDQDKEEIARELQQLAIDRHDREKGIADVLKEIADALKPSTSTSASSPSGGPRTRLKQYIAETILADLFPWERYPSGIPKEIPMLRLVDMIAGRWKSKCEELLPAGSKRPTPPEWKAVKRLRTLWNAIRP
jgi:hypothetical protein